LSRPALGCIRRCLLNVLLRVDVVKIYSSYATHVRYTVTKACGDDAVSAEPRP